MFIHIYKGKVLQHTEIGVVKCINRTKHLSYFQYICGNKH